MDKIVLPSRAQFRADWQAGYRAALDNVDRDKARTDFQDRSGFANQAGRPRLLAFSHGYNRGLQDALQARFGNLPD